MKNRFFFQVFSIMAILTLVGLSCKKLDTKVYDRIYGLGKSSDQVDAAVASVYAGLRDYAPANDPYFLNEGSSDEVIVPTRGGDWYDNDVWEKMWKHKWGPEIYFMDNGWKFIYSGVARVNSTLQILENASYKPANLAYIVASLKTIRAFYYYLAMDWFGNVPISEPGITDLSKLSYKTREEVFAYVEKEIKDNLKALTTDVNTKTYGMATQWFAQALQAKLYLNAEVFTGKPRWADCIAACDALLISNKFTLEPNFFTNFSVQNEVSRENIFVIPFDRTYNMNYFWLQFATLHYFSGPTFGLEGGGVNGFCSPEGIYNLFNPTDTRRKMFLVGQQYEGQTQYVYEVLDSSRLQYDVQVNLPLSFDPKINTFSSTDPAFRMAGVRCAKWEFNKGGGLMSNDFAIYRLADIILMKTEAQFRTGDVNGALKTINQKFNGVSIRSRANLPDFTLSEMNPDGLLAERGRELSWEGFRRNDMIRLGHFTDARIPEKGISEDYRKLYPIPRAELAKNPYLKQNPGY